MKILVVNAGSSSLKYQLFDMQNESVIAKGAVERIGIAGSVLKAKGNGKEKVYTQDMPDHKVAIQLVLHALHDDEIGVIKSMSEIGAVGHRVVASGEYFKKPTLVDDEVIKTLEEKTFELGPLHNPAAAAGLHACMDVMPGTPMVLVFDSSFHQTMPEKAYMFGIKYEDYKAYGVRKYGAHGTSHYYVSREVAKLIGKEGKIIVCHIGNGASLSAVDHGKCVDTSMGFTPLAGVMMGTRCGDIDPYIPLHIMKTQGKSVDEVNRLLNKESGMLGLCGFSDNRDVETAYLAGNEDAINATNVYIHTILRFIGSYIAVLGGVDAIAFTAGIGENSSMVRKMLCERLSYLGIELDEEANSKRGETIEISKAGSKVRVFVVPTNEELVIAQDTVNLI